MKVQRTIDEKRAIIERVYAASKNGEMTVSEAIRKEGLNNGQFYEWKNKLSGRRRPKAEKRANRKRQEPALLTLAPSVIETPEPKTDGRLICIIGTAGDIQSTLSTFLKAQG